METKRKKTLFNVIMVVLILIIAGCGIMAVGNLKGWFGKDEDSVLVSQNVKGVANIQRSGVGYGLEKNVSLRDVTFDGGSAAKHGLNIYHAGMVTLENVEISNCRWYALVVNGTELSVDCLTTS